ncbi:MAG: flagellar biosynthetic protein FliQ [Opitutaceae bacterium]
MNPDLAIELFKLTMFKALIVVAPFLLAALVVGLIVSLVQSVTSLQEQTLVFIPKLLTVVGVFLFLSPWLVRTLMEFTVACVTRMADMSH